MTKAELVTKIASENRAYQVTGGKGGGQFCFHCFQRLGPEGHPKSPTCGHFKIPH